MPTMLSFLDIRHLEVNANMQSEVSDVELTALSDNITFSTWQAHESAVQFFTPLQETGTSKEAYTGCVLQGQLLRNG